MTEPRIRYRDRWRRVPRELGYLLATLPIVIVTGSVVTALVSGGGGMIVIFIGVFLVVGALYVSRWLGRFDVIRLRAAGQEGVDAPAWKERRDRGFWAWLGSMLGDGHNWSYLAHTMLVNPIVGGITSSITWGIVLGVVTAPFRLLWMGLGSPGFGEWSSARPEFVQELVSDLGVAWSDRILEVVGAVEAWYIQMAPVIFVLTIILTLVFLVLLPYITHGFVRLHQLLAQGMLGRWRTEELRDEVDAVSASRSAAVSAEDASLRRLERDLHDGPQQRLVRLQMDLAAADRRIDDEPDAARALIAEAMEQSREALSELRNLSRGFAPPILLDRGLVAALESLAIRSVLPVVVISELPADLRLSPEVERNAYFVASELVTNAAKHSAAATVTVRLSAVDADGAVLPSETAEHTVAAIDVQVRDDGTGGAQEHPGHGLAGLRERALGLGGELVIDSPKGGPTVIGARIPLRSGR